MIAGRVLVKDNGFAAAFTIRGSADEASAALAAYQLLATLMGSAWRAASRLVIRWSAFTLRIVEAFGNVPWPVKAFVYVFFPLVGFALNPIAVISIVVLVFALFF